MPLTVSKVSPSVVQKEEPLFPTPLKTHQPPHIPDTLSKAPSSTKKDFTPSRPSLCMEMRLINTVGKARDVSQESLAVSSTNLASYQKDLEDITAKKIEKLQEKCEKTQSVHVWDTLRKVGSAILGAISAFFGLTLWSAGASTFVGAALITAGVLSLANLAFTECGIWKWIAEKLADDNVEKQKNLARILPTAVSLVAFGLGLAGIAAFGLWGALSATPKGLAVLQNAANFLTITGTAGGKISQGRVALAQADLHELQHSLSVNGYHVDKLTENLEQIMKHETEAQQAARNILNLSIQTKQAILA